MTRCVYALCALLLAGVFPLAAQERIEGRVIDTQGQPVPDLPVVLHGITQDGGAPMAEAVTDNSGRFVIPAAATPDDVRLLFIAARWNGKVYLGPALQPGAAVADYVLEVGGTSADDMLAQAPPPAAADNGRRYAALLIFVPLAAAVALLARALRADPGRARRNALRDLARIEEEAAAQPDDAARRAARDALRASLLAGSSRPAA